MRFSYQESFATTDGFANDRSLDQGASGQVTKESWPTYKGKLCRIDLQVAVKRIFAKSRHSKKVFIDEVKIISRMIHRNLVQFIGWYQEKREFLLVEDEYMRNSRLENHIFGARKSLPWNARYNISLGLASALNYFYQTYSSVYFTLT